ncbi:MAG: hypothetical protein EBT09_06875, partial [Actinobacteria bacterium]|nr:hypothetical protein [Actinomycetota bacterium]
MTGGSEPFSTVQLRLRRIDTDPTQASVTTLSRLASGYGHTCGLASNGFTYCWGFNGSGELGDGSTTDRVTPAAVAGGLKFASLSAAGQHTCGLVASGAAYCWGNNSHGQLGNGTAGENWGDSANRMVPVAVTGGLTFTSIVAGRYHTCGLTLASTAYCWGDNSNGQLGDGTTGGGNLTSRTAPVAVTGGLTFTSLVAGLSYTCGLVSVGTAYCWGSNPWGNLGDGTTGTDRPTPVAVTGGLTFTSLVAGQSHTCGLSSGGAVYCWGMNAYGQIGDGTTAERLTPTAVTGGVAFTRLVRGSNHTCGLAAGGTVYCWGNNGTGQLGDGTQGTNSTAPVAATAGRTFTNLVGGDLHTCGLDSSGTVYCWGWNNYGQLGDGTTTDRRTPVQVDASAVPQYTASLSIPQSVAMISKSSSPSPSGTATVTVTSTPTVIVSPTAASTASITPHPPLPAGGTAAGQPALPTQTVTPTANSSPSVVMQV